MIELGRRSFLASLGAVLVAAPAIVRVTSIMPVRSPVEAFTVDDMAVLLSRLDERANMWDGHYAEHFGQPEGAVIYRSAKSRSNEALEGKIIFPAPQSLTISEWSATVG